MRFKFLVFSVCFFGLAFGVASSPGLARRACASEPAGVTQTPAEQAEALKTRGDAQFRARDFAQAVASYDEAYALEPSPRLLYNKARALQALARYGEALAHLARFEQEASPELKAQVTGLSGLIGELRQKVTELIVRVNLDGAVISLRNEIVGNAPLTSPVLVNAGAATLRVTKEGYFSYDRQVDLAGGGTASFDVTLKSRAEHGKLIITSRVKGVSISVDGRPIGQAPTEVVLDPGTHAVLARRDGYEDAESQLVLESGQSRTLALDPVEKKGPIYTRGWFWGGVTLLAAGAATGIYFAVREEPKQTDGNFSPSAISAPLTRF
jgi:hypothetical protein